MQGFDEQFAYGEVGFPPIRINPKDIAARPADIIGNYETLSENAIEKCRKIQLAEHFRGI
ncbi:MAG: hypothetical protein U5K84_06560 [Alkalibacterium sp.]|nr:hypothetical protein [Alkalibacterium sp.]